MRIALVIAVFGTATVLAANADASAPMACESLARMAVTNGQVLSAEA